MGIGAVLIAGAILVVFVSVLVWLVTRTWPVGGSGSSGGSRAPTATLTVQPQIVCSEGGVRLQWSATGDTTTLSASPAARESLGRVTNSDAMLAHVTASGVTRFTLESTRSGQTPAIARAQVQVIDTSRGLPIGGQARCADWQGIRVMQVIVSHPATIWSSSIRVHRIEFVAGTTDFCEVYHDNVLVLSESMRAADLGGASITGEWRFQRPLLGPSLGDRDEVCEENSPQFHGWPSFTIIATITCS
jgi:hypothetical protein